MIARGWFALHESFAAQGFDVCQRCAQMVTARAALRQVRVNEGVQFAVDVPHQGRKARLQLPAAGLGPPLRGDVLDSKEDKGRRTWLSLEVAGVEDHGPGTDTGEGMFDGESLERGVTRQHVIEQFAESGDVPLVVDRLLIQTLG